MPTKLENLIGKYKETNSSTAKESIKEDIKKVYQQERFDLQKQIQSKKSSQGNKTDVTDLSKQITKLNKTLEDGHIPDLDANYTSMIGGDARIQYPSAPLPPPPPPPKKEETKITGTTMAKVGLDAKITQRSQFGEFNTSSNPKDWNITVASGKTLNSQHIVNFLNDMKAKTYKGAETALNQGKQPADQIELKAIPGKDNKITFSFVNKVTGKPVSKEMDDKIQQYYRENFDNNATQEIKKIKDGEKTFNPSKDYHETMKQLNNVKSNYTEPPPQKKEEDKEDKEEKKEDKKEEKKEEEKDEEETGLENDNDPLNNEKEEDNAPKLN